MTNLRLDYQAASARRNLAVLSPAIRRRHAAARMGAARQISERLGYRRPPAPG